MTEADPRSLLSDIVLSLKLTQPPKTKKERKWLDWSLKAVRITVEIGGLGPFYDMTAYDLYLLTLLRAQVHRHD